jgi:hypothetical protein
MIDEEDQFTNIIYLKIKSEGIVSMDFILNTFINMMNYTYIPPNLKELMYEETLDEFKKALLIESDIIYDNNLEAFIHRKK